MNCFDEMLEGPLQAESIKILQLNVGLLCNQSCRHCHLECSPARTESMNWPTMEKIITLASQIKPEIIDITGGAPELNPHLVNLINALTKQNLKLQLRTNLTAMLLEHCRHLPEFFATRKVNLIASVPCYLEENVDTVRGRDTFCKSIQVIKKLNQLGYGMYEHGPALDFVFNPSVALSLPPDQIELQNVYKRELLKRYGIYFNRLFTIANMPIGRYLNDLQRNGSYLDYISLLKDSFNKTTITQLMCRYQINIGWDGRIYDCDFNQALGLVANSQCNHISRLNPANLSQRTIVTDNHCLACTAGAGSSCSGALNF